MLYFSSEYYSTQNVCYSTHCSTWNIIFILSFCFTASQITLSLFPVRLQPAYLIYLTLFYPTQPHDYDIKCKYSSRDLYLQIDYRGLFWLYLRFICVIILTISTLKIIDDKIIYYSSAHNFTHTYTYTQPAKQTIQIYYLFPILPILSNNSPHKVNYVEIFRVIQRWMSRPGHGLQIESDYHYHMPPDQFPTPIKFK